jgi:hypothetical protein
MNTMGIGTQKGGPEAVGCIRVESGQGNNKPRGVR